jgi:hypothetical protein
LFLYGIIGFFGGTIIETGIEFLILHRAREMGELRAVQLLSRESDLIGIRGAEEGQAALKNAVEC